MARKRSISATLVLLAGCSPDGFTTGGDDRTAVREILEATRNPPPAACSTPAEFSDPACQKPEAWRTQHASHGSTFIFVHTGSTYVPAPPRPISVYAPTYASRPSAARPVAFSPMRATPVAGTAARASVTSYAAVTRGGFGSTGVAFSSAAG